MEFGILGPLLVRDEDGIRVVPSAKQRALLAALLVRRGQVTSAQLLARGVWDGCPPRGAAGALHNHVMRLRRGLGRAGERIETRAGGYLIDVAPAEFDAHRFAVLHREGVAALDRGQAERAAALLREALGVWRGPALLDVPSDALRREEGERLAEERLRALEARVAADLRLGCPAVAAELYALTAAHPGRERFWAQLMAALHRDGRQAEALTVYQRARRSLDAELGVRPGSELRELQHRILRSDLPAHQPADSRGAA